MTNRHRGEIQTVLDGKPYRLCLTLGALAELESAYGDEDMLAIAERFETGHLKAVDAIRIIGAGLRGAGYDIGDDAVAAMNIDGGAAGYVRAVASLLNATFPAEASETGAAAATGQDGPAGNGDTVRAAPANPPPASRGPD